MSSLRPNKIVQPSLPADSGPCAAPNGPTAYREGVPYYGEPYMESIRPESINPFHLLFILRKKWMSIALVVLFAVCGATFYLAKTDRLYQARSLIELSLRRPRIVNRQAAVIEDPADSYQFEEVLNTQMEKLRSRAVIPYALACYRQADPEDPAPDAVLKGHLQRGVGFSLIRRTRLVTISFVDSDPVFAARACNAFAGAAEAIARAENRAASDAAVVWLELQARTQREELDRADKELLEARQACKMDLLESQRKTVQDALLNFNKSLVDVESEATKESELLATLNAIELKPENAGRLPTAIPRANEVEEALKRWLTAVAERDSLLSKYTVEHPEIVSRAKAIDLFREQAQSALNRTRMTAESNLKLFNRQAESLRQKKEEQSRLASELERSILDSTMKLGALERARNACEASSQGVLNRIQEARLSADENTATVKLVESAVVPQRPVRPRVMSIILLALVLGFAGGVGLALATATLEDRVADAHDVEVETGIKVLAVVPHVKAGSRKEVARSSLSRRPGQIAESFAGLRSVLDSAAYREQSRVILIVSSIPEEGKTTTCCNLATACARNGQRTLLIDFDLRRPRLAGIFPMPPAITGLLEYLGGGATDPSELVYEADCENLHVIASRPVMEANPADVVGQKKVVDMFAWALSTYDRVIIDAPPLGIVSDALVLAGLVDAVVITVRPEVSRKRAIRHTVRRFRDTGVRLIVGVMTDVDLSKSAYHSYGPYYHYSKHYESYLPEQAHDRRTTA